MLSFKPAFSLSFFTLIKRVYTQKWNCTAWTDTEMPLSESVSILLHQPPKQNPSLGSTPPSLSLLQVAGRLLYSHVDRLRVLKSHASRLSWAHTIHSISIVLELHTPRMQWLFQTLTTTLQPFSLPGFSLTPHFTS